MAEEESEVDSGVEEFEDETEMEDLDDDETDDWEEELEEDDSEDLEEESEEDESDEQDEERPEEASEGENEPAGGEDLDDDDDVSRIGDEEEKDTPEQEDMLADNEEESDSEDPEKDSPNEKPDEEKGEEKDKDKEKDAPKESGGEESEESEGGLKFKLEEKYLMAWSKAYLFAIRPMRYGWPFFVKRQHKENFKKLKNHPNLKDRYDLIKTEHDRQASNLKMDLQKYGWTALIILGFVFLGVVAVSAGVGALYLLFSWLFPQTEGGKGTGSSIAGVSGEHFYGTRAIYRSEDRAIQENLETYVEYVENAVRHVETITDFDGMRIDITVDIEFPEEDYDYSKFVESNFETEFPKLSEIVSNIASNVALLDNPSVEAIPEVLGLSDRLRAVKYLGVNSSLVDGDGKIKGIDELVADYIKTNYNFTAYSTDPETGIETKIEDVETLTAFKEKIDLEIANQVNASCNELLAISNVRTEKLFVRDFVFSSDTDQMKDIQTANYIAMIYMPKHNVTFNKTHLVISFIDASRFDAHLSKNGANFGLSETIEIEDGEDKSYSFKSGNSLGIALDEYEYNALPEEDCSILDLYVGAREGVEPGEPVTEIFGEFTEVLGYLMFNYSAGDALVLNFENPDNFEFTFVEFETIVE